MAEHDSTDDALTVTTEDERLLARHAARVAACDQETAEWADDAAKIVAFWSTLREAGMPKSLAGMLTINAQHRYYIYLGENDDDEDDDD